MKNAEKTSVTNSVGDWQTILFYKPIVCSCNVYNSGYICICCFVWLSSDYSIVSKQIGQESERKEVKQADIIVILYQIPQIELGMRVFGCCLSPLFLVLIMSIIWWYNTRTDLHYVVL